MQQIASIQSDDRIQNQLQSNITSVLNPLLKNNPILFGNTVTNVSLKAGDNTVNTNLKTPLIGWVIIRKRANANIYDKQDSNNATGTLILNSSADVVVDIIVF